MQIIKRQEVWDPFRDLEELSSRFNRLFGLVRATGNGEGEVLAATDWSPTCDVSETDQAYHIRAELPGVQKADVHVSLDHGVLTIQGERKETKEEKRVKYHRREVSYGSFLRRFTMPDDADAEKVDASFKDGVLEIDVTRSKGKSTGARQIAIR